MAVPIFSSSSPSHSSGWFHTLPTPNISIPQKRNLISCCAPSELNPTRSEVRRPEVSFCVETHLIPHPNKVEKGGEDAFFVSSYNGGAVAVAVADGVSGNEQSNAVPDIMAEFSLVGIKRLLLSRNVY
ncbi:protein phosphatase 2C family protein [Actinidia rufa]|uniref:Protein phosphatase 2C family protein n=1 Tax=Actinidia rufa TaxID=165716 RepID=A0A7J0FS81_9ERIC|nr:protein phosphatase 2C family protein [Actinidia rufa]